MARIPVRFNRIAAAFNEAARAPPVRLCESSGSDHSPEDLTDLSDLVNSFIESNCGVIETDEAGKIMEQEKDNENEGSEGYWSDSETKDMIKNLVCNEQDDDVKQNIRVQTELICDSIEDMSSDGSKRQLMSRLREKGFDAGLCKSRWERFGQHPAGRYEYVDVNVNGNRYIIEVNLGGEFEIARPTTSYTSLLNVFPRILVIKAEEMKQIVRLMCRAIRESMKSKELKIPPWRRRGYMQAKWFGHYKRTTNEISVKNTQKNDAVATKRSVGFEMFPSVSYYCRDNFARKAGLKVGYLTAAFNANG
ncbi:hypothetical protein COLO4_31871 [Corchorus olitorius]|uniref:DUF506 family protein n=1 Tax=Corchorus olitorius TaxID=93759 RepID=A0A1R3H322_9ROSI|nr:hypothetical protein COLO4_31871 [Corchorus olitorius]